MTVSAAGDLVDDRLAELGRTIRAFAPRDERDDRRRDGGAHNVEGHDFLASSFTHDAQIDLAVVGLLVADTGRDDLFRLGLGDHVAGIRRLRAFGAAGPVSFTLPGLILA